MERWRFPTWNLPLERQFHPHPWGVVRTGLPTGAKLVGSTDKGRSAGDYQDLKMLVLKGQGWGMRRVCLPCDPLPIVCTPPANPSRNCSGKVEAQWSMDMSGHQRLCNGDLGMPDLESHWLAKRLAFLGRSLTNDTEWGQKVKKAFLRLKSNPKAESCRKPKSEAPFFAECCKLLRNLSWSTDLSRSRNYIGS